MNLNPIRASFNKVPYGVQNDYLTKKFKIYN